MATFSRPRYGKFQRCCLKNSFYDSFSVVVLHFARAFPEAKRVFCFEWQPRYIYLQLSSYSRDQSIIF